MAILVALGSTRSQIALRAVSHIVVLATVGLLVAIAVAPLIAAVLPLGLGGVIADDDIRFDVTATGLGILGLLAVVAAITALSTWRLVAGTRTVEPVTELTTDRAIGSLRLRPAAQTGVMGAVGRPAGRRLASPWPGVVSLVLHPGGVVNVVVGVPVCGSADCVGSGLVVAVGGSSRRRG